MNFVMRISAFVLLLGFLAACAGGETQTNTAGTDSDGSQLSAPTVIPATQTAPAAVSTDQDDQYNQVEDEYALDDTTSASPAVPEVAAPDEPTATAVAAEPEPTEAPTITPESVAWAFEETFDGDPPAPSQELLPQTFDYVVTQRSHPKAHFDPYDPFPADHGADCSGPNPEISPLPQHQVVTLQATNGSNPDQSFFICKNHMMSSMGQVDSYSVTAFWPKQAFNFADGGVLEFDININGDRPRVWWEVMISPRDQLKVGAAHEMFPIDETYPQDRIVLSFLRNRRWVIVGQDVVGPTGRYVEQREFPEWSQSHPNDPANNDRRIRRTHRLSLQDNQLVWSIEQEDGTFDDFIVPVPDGLPMDEGLVVFKTHAYLPEKEDNYDNYTFHWDNIRFTGPVTGRYEVFEAQNVVYLQGNGNQPIGKQESVTIDLPYIGPNPILAGQLHSPKIGQVLLSINGQPDIEVRPFDYDELGLNDCFAKNWKSFQMEVDPEWLVEGANTLTWTIGPRPDCADNSSWDGFSVKSLEIQFDLPEAAEN